MNIEEFVDTYTSEQYRADMLMDLLKLIDAEREACAVASEVWTEGRSRFLTAADAIRARKPLK